MSITYRHYPRHRHLGDCSHGGGGGGVGRLTLRAALALQLAVIFTLIQLLLGPSSSLNDIVAFCLSVSSNYLTLLKITIESLLYLFCCRCGRSFLTITKEGCSIEPN